MAATLHKGFVRHRKFTVLSDRAFRVWMAGWSFCNEELTDGLIYKTDLAVLGVRVTPKVVRELTQITPPFLSPLWEDRGDFYLMHDFLHWNNSKVEVQQDRERLRLRVRMARAKRQGEGNGQKSLDSDACTPVTTSVTVPVTALVTSPVTTPATPPASNGVSNRVNYEQRPMTNGTKRKNCALARAPCSRSVEKNTPAFRVIAALVRAQLRSGRDYRYDGGEADLLEDLKNACAKAGLAYDSTTIRKALDFERVKRAGGAA